eukprot:1148502-Pelagomonas_calceolata.AAC.1
MAWALCVCCPVHATFSVKGSGIGFRMKSPHASRTMRIAPALPAATECALKLRSNSSANI